MVLIHFKKSEKNSFILEVPSDTLVCEVLAQIIEYNNIRMYLDRLIWSIEELANKGVLKPAEIQGLSFDEYEKSPQQFVELSPEKLKYAARPKVQAPYRFVPDKHNQRYGVILPEEDKQLLLNAVKKGKQVMEPKTTTVVLQDILDAIDGLREATMTAYPGYLDLPEWEPAYLLLEEKLCLEVLQSENFELYDSRGVMWWAGKELEKSKKISEYSGKNEKTKIIVKVQKAGGEQPLREPPIDAKAYQQMVKYYYKKVDESKEFDSRIIETHYEKIEGPSMKQKLHLGSDQVKYKMF